MTGDKRKKKRRAEKSVTPTVGAPESSRKRKEAQLVLRLDKALRDEFVDACQAEDTSASREIRRFMRRFLDTRAKRQR